MGTWCDHLAVQAVSDALNVTIHITESHAHLFWDIFAFRYFPTGRFPLLHNRFVIKSNRRDGAGIGDFFLQYFSVQNMQNVNVNIQCTLAIFR